MKRKVRVHGFYLPKHQEGGNIKQTQDSNDSNVANQQNIMFSNWLKNTNEEALYKQNLELLQNQIRGIAQGGITMRFNNVPYEKPPINGDNEAWIQHAEKNKPNMFKDLNVLGNNIGNIFSRPDKYVMDEKSHDLFKDRYNIEGYNNPVLKSFTVDNITKNGKKRTINYTANGTQEYVGFPKTENSGNSINSNNITEDPSKKITPNYLNSEDNNDPHGYMNFIEGLNNKVNNANPTYTFPSEKPFNFNPSIFDRSWQEKNPELFKMLGTFKYGGNLPKAQNGNFPYNGSFVNLYQDYNLLNKYPENVNSNLSTTHGYMDFLHNLNTDVAQNTGTENPQYDAMGVKSDSKQDNSKTNLDLTEKGSIDLKKVSKFKQATDANPYLMSDSILAGMHLLSNIGNADERAAEEKAIRERVSNVHRLYGTQGADRGDYMVNAPGVGDFLKPDQHTRMGYNTKIAQDGYQINDELDLSDEEIQDLINKGYTFDMLD